MLCTVFQGMNDQNSYKQVFASLDVSHISSALLCFTWRALTSAVRDQSPEILLYGLIALVTTWEPTAPDSANRLDLYWKAAYRIGVLPDGLFKQVRRIVGEPKAIDLRQYVMQKYSEFPLADWTDFPKKEVVLALVYCGAKILEHADLKSFGSWYLIFHLGSHVCRLVFDGRDSVYEVQCKTTPPVAEGWLPVGFAEALGGNRRLVSYQHAWQHDRWLKVPAKASASLFAWLLAPIEDACR